MKQPLTPALLGKSAMAHCSQNFLYGEKCGLAAYLVYVAEGHRSSPLKKGATAWLGHQYESKNTTKTLLDKPATASKLRLIDFFNGLAGWAELAGSIRTKSRELLLP
jgi:hypothetical protein